jgi:hypothetical protein
VPQPPRVTVIGSSEEPLVSGAQAADAAGGDVLIAICADPAAFEPFADGPVPAIAWCAAGGRPRLGPRDRWVSAAWAPGAWRHLPLPVDDARFAAAGGGVHWLGDPSERRSEYLARYPAPEGGAPVAINLRDADPVRLEHRAAAALAAGLVLVSEPLERRRGLEPGLDHVEAEELDDVFAAVEAARRRPQAFERMRLRGRAKAEAFRASTLTERVATDLLLELR